MPINWNNILRTIIRGGNKPQTTTVMRDPAHNESIIVKPNDLQMKETIPPQVAIVKEEVAAKPSTLSEAMKRADANILLGLKGRKIGIIVGHEKRRPGAVIQFGPMRGVTEYKYNMLVASYLLTIIRELGGNGEIIFRDEIGVAGAYTYAKEMGAEFVIELHFNLSANEAALGVETLISDAADKSKRVEEYFATNFANRIDRYMRKELYAIAKEGLKMTPDTIYKELTRNFIRHGNGVLQVRRGDRGGVNVNTLPDIPCVLVEPFFGSNELSCMVFASSAGAERIAEMLAETLSSVMISRG